ncbi:MAG: hypothetical protein JXR78_03225 [Victivallales bacterium]|nr:hypothetical protein [Victivallales bacterium]
MVDFYRNSNPHGLKQIIKMSFITLILVIALIINISMNGYAANQGNNAEGLIEYGLQSIGIITAPEAIKVGDEAVIVIKLTAKVSSPAMLRCDLHYRNAKGGGFLAATASQKISEKQRYEFKIKVLPKESIYQVIPIIYITPDGSWKNKIINAQGRPIKVIQISPTKQERILSSSYPMSFAKHTKVKIQGRKEQVLEHKAIWKPVGPGFLNVPMNVHIDGNTILMLIDIGGLIRSTDGGKSWHYLSYSLEGGIAARNFHDFDVNPVKPDSIIICGDYIFHSEDGGKTWNETAKGLPEFIYNQWRNSYGKIKYTSNGKTIFTAVGGGLQATNSNVKQTLGLYTRKTIYFSRDNGVSFSKLEISGKPSVVAKIYPHPSRSDTVYFSFRDGTIFKIDNANAEKPELVPVSIPDGYYVVDMSINPVNADELLLALNPIDGKNNASVYLLNGNNLRKISLSVDGKEKSIRKISSISYNPNKPTQVIIGCGGDKGLFISNDSLKTFHEFYLPQKFYANSMLGHFYGAIERVFFGKSPIAVVVSMIGAWATDDNFGSLRDLSMIYSNGTLGNRGVSSPANINNIAITRNDTFFSAQDHGAWRSASNDLSRWIPVTGLKQQKAGLLQDAPWGKYTWFWRIGNIFASDDAGIVYICCNAMMNKKKNGFEARKKFMRSHDRGETWQDITAKLGLGDVFPEGNTVVRMIFDPQDSARHWLLMSNMLFYTEDGGNHFLRQSPPAWDEKSKPNFWFSDITYDAGHNVLYLSSKTNRLHFQEKLNHDMMPAALYRSFDHGKTWQPYDIGQHSIASLGVTDTGTLVVGTLKTADQPARLIIIPWGKSYSPDMIRLTAGDTLKEISHNQIEIAPIICDGEDIFAYSNNAWIRSDRTMGQGPLLSRDGGKSFKWIVYNLPITSIWSADMKHGKILIGTTFGLMYWKYK